MSMEVDRSAWPIVIYTARGEQGEGLMKQFCANLEEDLRRAEKEACKYVLIFDLRMADLPDAAGRKVVSDFGEEHAERHNRCRAGVLNVVAQSLYIGVCKSIAKYRETAYPVEHYTTLTDAKLRASELMQELASGAG